MKQKVEQPRGSKRLIPVKQQQQNDISVGILNNLDVMKGFSLEIAIENNLIDYIQLYICCKISHSPRFTTMGNQTIMFRRYYSQD